MTSRRNLRRLAGAVAALTLIAAACGDDDDNASSATTAAAAPTTEAPAATTAAPATEAPAATTAAPATEAPSASTVPAEASSSAAECDTPEPVKLQLQWFVQSQFAGYYAAKDQGFYEAQCIDLEILEGGVEIVPQTQLANGDADFAIAWRSLRSRRHRRRRWRRRTRCPSCVDSWGTRVRRERRGCREACITCMIFRGSPPSAGTM